MRSLASVLLLVITACTPLLPSPQPAGPDVRQVLEPTALPTPRAAAPSAPQLAVLAVRPEASR